MPGGSTMGRPFITEPSEADIRMATRSPPTSPFALFQNSEKPRTPLPS
jgi:hypothetical protein